MKDKEEEDKRDGRERDRRNSNTEIEKEGAL